MTSIPAIVVHGGASGNVEDITQRILGCAEAAEVGLKILLEGGSSLDAVEAAVRSLENNPYFNAGIGAALTEDGEVQLDASIMDGTTLEAGAVAAIEGYQNPVTIARAVMADGKHVLMVGQGAAKFAAGCGFTPVDPESLITEGSRERLETWRQDTEGVDPASLAGNTVGAVAIDELGHLAAATSTGGLTGKKQGRVGDSAVIGAGTYADDTKGAVSCTGRGEDMLRTVLAREAAGLCENQTAQQAAEAAIKILEDRVGGSGGLIVVGRDGTVGLAHNTTTMAYAIGTAGKPIQSGIAIE